MNIVKTLRNTLFRWQQKLLFSLLRTRRIGTDADELQPDLSRPGEYAVLNESLAERLVIDREVQQLGWPSPHLQRLQNQLPAKPVFSIHRRRSEEHTSELQSREDLVCRRLLE